MREILPGLFHWTAVHPEIQIEVSSYYVEEPGAVLDPLIPAEGLGWFSDHVTPRHVILTNRLHYRHSREFADAFGCGIWCNERGLHHFKPDQNVRVFRAGEPLPGGIESYEVGALCPDETALRIPIDPGVLAVADGVIRYGDGPLAFVPDFLLGDDPEAVKKSLKAAYVRLLDLEFDHVLFAHGNPWIGGAKKALRAFVESRHTR
jgi:hypothetical protein